MVPTSKPTKMNSIQRWTPLHPKSNVMTNPTELVFVDVGASVCTRHNQNERKCDDDYCFQKLILGRFYYNHTIDWGKRNPLFFQ